MMQASARQTPAKTAGVLYSRTSLKVNKSFPALRIGKVVRMSANTTAKYVAELEEPVERQ